MIKLYLKVDQCNYPGEPCDTSKFIRNIPIAQKSCYCYLGQFFINI